MERGRGEAYYLRPRRRVLKRGRGEANNLPTRPQSAGALRNDAALGPVVVYKATGAGGETTTRASDSTTGPGRSALSVTLSGYPSAWSRQSSEKRKAGGRVERSRSSCRRAETSRGDGPAGTRRDTSSPPTADARRTVCRRMPRRPLATGLGARGAWQRECAHGQRRPPATSRVS